MGELCCRTGWRWGGERTLFSLLGGREKQRQKRKKQLKIHRQKINKQKFVQKKKSVGLLRRDHVRVLRVRPGQEIVRPQQLGAEHTAAIAMGHSSQEALQGENHGDRQTVFV